MQEKQGRPVGGAPIQRKPRHTAKGTLQSSRFAVDSGATNLSSAQRNDI